MTAIFWVMLVVLSYAVGGLNGWLIGSIEGYDAGKKRATQEAREKYFDNWD